MHQSGGAKLNLRKEMLLWLPLDKLEVYPISPSGRIEQHTTFYIEASTTNTVQAVTNTLIPSPGHLKEGMFPRLQDSPTLVLVLIDWIIDILLRYVQLRANYLSVQPSNLPANCVLPLRSQ